MIGELDREEAEIFSDRVENGSRPSRSAFQRRVDRITGEKYRLLQENEELRQENQELRGGLERALALVDRFRARKESEWQWLRKH
jgi:hypothetical protein